MGVPEDASVDQTAADDGVDGAADEDDRQGDTESHPAESVPGRQQRRALHVHANKSIDQRTSERVDEDFHQTQRPDRLDKVLGGVHLVHERELAHGETVGEDDVGDGDESIGEGDAFLGPGGPLHSGQTPRCIAARDASANDGDADGGNNRREVDVAQNRHFGETRRDGDQQQDDGRHNAKHDGADGTLGDVGERNRAGQTVRAGQEGELEDEHDIDQFIAEAAEHEPSCIGIVGDLRELELDLTDDVTGIDGDKSQTNTADDTSHHTQGREGGGDRQTTKRNGLHDEHNGQTLPSETAEFLYTVLIDVSLGLAHLPNHVSIVLGRSKEFLALLIASSHGFAGIRVVGNVG